MRGKAIRSGRLIRTVYAVCLLVATCTHVAPLIEHGVFWDYGGVGWASAAFWTALTVADPLAAACLFAWPRVGVGLTSAIIGLDVLHNGVVFREVLLHPSAGHLWTYTAFGLQVAFLLFVMATVRVAWSQAPPLSRGLRTDGAVAGAEVAAQSPPVRGGAGKDTT
jgi:hypothetical protein